MDKFLEKVIVNSINGTYHIYLYNDGNALPKIRMKRIENEKEILVENVYQALKKLNNEFSFEIEYEPKNRNTKFNTREFGQAFVKKLRESRN